MGCKQDFVQIWSTYFPADLANVPKTLIFKHDISSTGRTMNNVILFLHRMNPTASATHAEYKMRLSIAFRAVPFFSHKFHARHNFCLTHDELGYVRRSRNRHGYLFPLVLPR